MCVADFLSTLVRSASARAFTAAIILFCTSSAGTIGLQRPSTVAQNAPSLVGGQESAPPEPKTFEVVAKRFAFEPATIEVTEGDRVRLLIRSADGPHGLEIKRFKVKKAVPRAKPGDAPVVIEFVASEAGTYPILCSEYCGNGHEDMTGTLLVQAKPKGAE